MEPEPIRQRFRRPIAALAGHVATLWECEVPALPHARERIVPDGSTSLVVNLADDELRHYRADGTCVRLRGAALHGPQTEPFVIDTAEQSAAIGVHFKPGGARPFFGVAANELRGRHLSLEDLWGSAAGALRNELLEARSPAARFDALERALLRRAGVPAPRHPGMLAALGALACPGASLRVAALEERLGVSRSGLARRFEDEVGLGPKRLARILRFQRALERLGAPAAEGELARLALDCGYYDHAHFARDFRGFAGASPSEIQAAGGARANHLSC